MAKKHTYEEIKNKIAETGCTLLDETYIHSHVKLNIKCKCGNAFSVKWNSFQQKKKQCNTCGYNNTKIKMKDDFEKIEKYFKDQSCVLISKEYFNNRQKLDYICSCGTIDKISFANFYMGHRCQQCRIKNMSGSNHHNWNPNRIEVELNRKIGHRCGTLLGNTLKSVGLKKNAKTHKILGYTRKQLKEHLTNHENWNNVKDSIWHIDHIYPVKAFLDFGILIIYIL